MKQIFFYTAATLAIILACSGAAMAGEWKAVHLSWCIAAKHTAYYCHDTLNNETYTVSQDPCKQLAIVHLSNYYQHTEINSMDAESLPVKDLYFTVDLFNNVENCLLSRGNF